MYIQPFSRQLTYMEWPESSHRGIKQRYALLPTSSQGTPLATARCFCRPSKAPRVTAWATRHEGEAGRSYTEFARSTSELCWSRVPLGLDDLMTNARAKDSGAVGANSAEWDEKSAMAAAV